MSGCGLLHCLGHLISKRRGWGESVLDIGKTSRLDVFRFELGQHFQIFIIVLANSLAATFGRNNHPQLMRRIRVASDGWESAGL